MKKIKLGVSELNASRIGLGVMRMGTRSDLEAQKAVESAIGNGINFLNRQIFMVMVSHPVHLVAR